jgi:hypothetical protein
MIFCFFNALIVLEKSDQFGECCDVMTKTVKIYRFGHALFSGTIHFTMYISVRIYQHVELKCLLTDLILSKFFKKITLLDTATPSDAFCLPFLLATTAQAPASPWDNAAMLF